MVKFGDVIIPWLVDKDTSITKDVVEKNFVDEPPQVFELNSDLESGTYSAILNENYHDRNESFVEQEDAVLSMVSRHGTEFPFESASDEGYALVESANVNTFPSLEIREADITLRFLDNDEYRAAFKASPDPFDGGDFETDAGPAESFFAVPLETTVSGETPDFEIDTEEGTLFLYLFDSKGVYEYDEDSNDITLSQNHSICRLFNNGGDRIYSDKRIVSNGSTLNNGLAKAHVGQSESDFEYYDGTSWYSIGSASLSFNQGYAYENSNDEISLEFVNGKEISIYRGFTIAKYKFDSTTSFDFTPENSFTHMNTESYYAYWEDSNDHRIIIVRTLNDGDFYTDASEFGIDGLDSTEEYNVFVGIVPPGIDPSDYARYVYNMGNRSRSFVSAP